MKKIVVVILFFCLIGFVSATDYYVSPNGNNSEDGSINSPWKTLKYAESKISSGDSVIARGGVYHEYFAIDVPNVVFKNYPGETPIVDGEWALPSPTHVKSNVGGAYTGLIDIQAEGITLEGFEVQKSTGRGVGVGANGDGTIIRKCSVHDIDRSAIGIIGADNVLVEDCDLYRGAYIVSQCNFNAGLCRDTGWGDPAMVNQPSSDGVIFRRCKIHDSYNEGINIERYSTNTLLEYNEIYANGKSQLYICSADNATVRYNLIYGVPTNLNGRKGWGSGIYLNNEENWEKPDSGGHKVYGNIIANINGSVMVMGRQLKDDNGTIVYYTKVSNSLFYNNLFFHPITGGTTISFGPSSAYGTGHFFINNVILQDGVSGKISYAPSGRVSADYNLWSEDPDEDLTGANDITNERYEFSDIDWSNLKSGDLKIEDFILRGDFSGINKGMNLSIEYSKDYYGNIRGAGGKWDIGAFEYVSGENPICGNNLTESGEICDGMDLNGRNCSSVNVSFVSGNLSCFLNCSGYDVSRCVVGGTPPTCSVRLSHINQKMIDWRDRKCVLGDVIALIRQWVAEGRC